MLNLNIGSGKDKLSEEFIRLDIDLSCKPNVCARAEALPFKNGVFDKVVASHVLEHIPDIVSTLNEVYRVLKWNGDFIVEVPEFPHWKAVVDPTHVRYFIQDTFKYFEGMNRLSGFKGSFQITGFARGEKGTPTEGNLDCYMRKN